MIEAIIAAGLACAVTVFAKGIYDDADMGHNAKSKIEDRIRRMVDSRLNEYKEQGRISDHEYILLLNKRSNNDTTIRNQTVNSVFDTNIVITTDNKCSYSNSSHYQDLGLNTYTLITTMNKMLSRLDDIYAKLEKNSSLNNNEEEQERKILDLGKERNKNKVRQNKSVTKIKKGHIYNIKNKEKEEEYRKEDSDKERNINTNSKEELNYLPINTINDNNNSSSNNNDYEFNEIEELKKQIADMISKLDKEIID